MTEQQIHRLLALKKCETPDEDKLSRVESNFRYALRIERVRNLSRPTGLTTSIMALFRWSPALVGAILFAAATYQFNSASQPLAEAGHSENNNISRLQNTGLQPPTIRFRSDPWAGSASTVPATYPGMRNAAFDARPVVFDESRITF